MAETRNRLKAFLSELINTDEEFFMRIEKYIFDINQRKINRKVISHPEGDEHKQSSLRGIRKESEEKLVENQKDDDVNFTVFYEKGLVVKEWANMLVYVHLPKCLDEITHDSQFFLDETNSGLGKSSSSSAQLIQRGTEITIIPELAGCVFNPPKQSVLWMEDWHRVGFRVRTADQSTLDINGLPRIGQVAFYIGPLLVAEVPIWAEVLAQGGSEHEPKTINRKTAAVYRTIFISYSHKDTNVVERLSSAYKVLGMQYLRDVESLRSGEEWNQALLKMIREADIFQLYWSANAKQSIYVEQEWRFALSLERENFIRPLFWELPMPVPPEDLGHLHFSSLDI